MIFPNGGDIMTESIYISSKEAAELLHISTRRAVGLCNDGKFEGAFQQGRNWRIPRKSVLTYMYGETGALAKEAEGVLPCPVGTTSFIDIVRNNYYVDKTLLIRDLLDDHAAVTLFTRPRRFGKTLALDMLKTYFEKTGEDTSVYFQNKKIWSCGPKYREAQGHFPVIALTFKDVKCSDWESSLEMIRIVIRDEFMRHAELFNSEKLNAVEKEYLQKMQAGSLSNVEYTRALLNLCRMLEKQHQTKVVILIDEYDTPIQQGHSHGFYDNIIVFMRNFMSGGLKDNPSLAFGVLTGILRVSKENLFSGLNNPVVNSVLEEKYSEYFGFTADEVEAMAAYYGASDKMDEIREWYDGYRFGNTEIYNPWSVVNYFYQNCQAKPYWTNTSDNEIVREILVSLTPEIAENLFSLVQGKTVQTSLNMDVIYPQITDGNDSIFSFLMVAGYLKPTDAVTETEFGTFAQLALPNKEVRRVYNSEILSWLQGTISGNVMAEIEKALYLNDGKKLKNALRKYMITCISSFDGAAEGFYHGMMLGLAAGMSSGYYIRSNRESGDGRFDLALEPKIASLPGILMEFKAEKDEKKLEASAADALAQIDSKKYETDMKDRGICEITKYGIAFAGKHVEIASE